MRITYWLFGGMEKEVVLNADILKQIISESVKEILEGRRYQEGTQYKFAQFISEEIEIKLKPFKERYSFAIFVFVMAKGRFGLIYKTDNSKRKSDISINHAVDIEDFDTTIFVFGKKKNEFGKILNFGGVEQTIKSVCYNTCERHLFARPEYDQKKGSELFDKIICEAKDGILEYLENFIFAIFCIVMKNTKYCAWYGKNCGNNDVTDGLVMHSYESMGYRALMIIPVFQYK